MLEVKLMPSCESVALIARQLSTQKVVCAAVADTDWHKWVVPGFMLAFEATQK